MTKNSMNTVSQQIPLDKPTRADQRAVVETKLREIQAATVELLQQIDDADPCGGGMLRAEATRLNGIGFTLTRLLCLDDVQRAYELLNGDADEDGTVLGVAV